MNPKVSIIMPSLNVRDYIEECLKSVCIQAEKDIEIICVDAGSSDGTYDVLLDFQRNDARIKVLVSDLRSYGYQVNMGISAATGEYIAILETDDFVDSRMYGSLYEQAKGKRLDYIKADYIGFTSCSNGALIEQNLMMSRCAELYEKVIEPGEYPELFLEDYNVWRGIYRREFLINQDIRMNETAGASFQDIGFMQQVLLKAKRAMYVHDFFYHYRMDREESSTFKPAVLQFAYQEFEYLLKDKSLLQNISRTKKENLYFKMIEVFILQFTRAVRMCGYHYEDNKIAPYYMWFSKVIQEQLKQDGITTLPFSDEYKDRLELLLNNPKEFVRKIQMDDEQKKDIRERFIQKIGNSPVVIFGCGNYGKDVYVVCDQNAVKIQAFCDNNPECWNKQIWGVPILNPDECFVKYQDSTYVIANKRHWQEIKLQLTEHNILNIVVCNEKI